MLLAPTVVTTGGEAAEYFSTMPKALALTSRVSPPIANESVPSSVITLLVDETSSAPLPLPLNMKLHSSVPLAALKREARMSRVALSRLPTAYTELPDTRTFWKRSELSAALPRRLVIHASAPLL